MLELERGQIMGRLRDLTAEIEGIVAASLTPTATTSTTPRAPR